MQDFVRVMKALTDPSRVAVVRMLERREMCACEIVDLLGLAQPTVSRHLRVLQDAGLVLGRKKGVWVHYRLPEDPPSPLIATLLANLPHWLGADPGLARLLDAMEAENPCSAADRAGRGPHAADNHGMTRCGHAADTGEGQ